MSCLERERAKLSLWLTGWIRSHITMSSFHTECLPVGAKFHGNSPHLATFSVAIFGSLFVNFASCRVVGVCSGLGQFEY